jgi:acyl carrier protein
MQDTVLEEVKRLLARALRDTGDAPAISDDADIVADLGLDSLQMISFLLDVEAQLGIALDFENLDIATLGSVRQFARYVAGLMSTARSA